MDALDRCPQTPRGQTVDATGCEIDCDADGVANSHDRCPNTPPGRSVDDQGPAAYNQDLSQRRAERVRAYLLDKGVAIKALHARGFGEERPLADNGTAAGRAINRRVELRRPD